MIKSPPYTQSVSGSHNITLWGTGPREPTPVTTGVNKKPDVSRQPQFHMGGRDPNKRSIIWSFGGYTLGGSQNQKWSQDSTTRTLRMRCLFLNQHDCLLLGQMPTPTKLLFIKHTKPSSPKSTTCGRWSFSQSNCFYTSNSWHGSSQIRYS